ncbi:MAG TPA: hypothetical protein VHR66_15975 [Gemmataceae bacterium]|jgi:hypothetical protein|nr:hypothetical protein [Gemmataceae bacterium]
MPLPSSATVEKLLRTLEESKKGFFATLESGLATPTGDATTDAFVQGICDHFKKFGTEHYRMVTLLARQLLDTLQKLEKHRRPKKNGERDAEIMRLHGAGKTAGQIVLALAARWELSDKSVNAVISRERRKKK